MSSCKPPACLLDLILTTLLREILQSTHVSLLDVINLSLLSGFALQSFEVAGLKPKKPSILKEKLYAEMLDKKGRLEISLYLAKVIEKLFAGQVFNYLQSSLYDDSWVVIKCLEKLFRIHFITYLPPRFDPLLCSTSRTRVTMQGYCLWTLGAHLTPPSWTDRWPKYQTWEYHTPSVAVMFREQPNLEHSKD